MTNLYFVRHAHSTYTPDELNRPLSEKGFSDANMGYKAVKAEGMDVVLSSPYKRAIQTVKGIAETIHTDIEIIDGLKERTLTTVPAHDFAVAIEKVWENYNFSWEGGESNFMAQKRGVEATLKILEKYKDKNVVIGTHGNIMVLIMNFFNRQYDFSFWQNLDMPDIYKLTFDEKVLQNVKRIWERK